MTTETKIREAYISYCKTQKEFPDSSEVFEAGYKAAMASLEFAGIGSNARGIGNDFEPLYRIKEQP